MQLLVETDGSIRGVYGEEINLRDLGRLAVVRASRVEPDELGQWLVDLSPVGGPALGPFPLRSAALAAEGRWLAENWPRVPPKTLAGATSPIVLPSGQRSTRIPKHSHR